MNFENLNLQREKREIFLRKWNRRYPVSSGRALGGMLVFSNDQIWLERNGETTTVIPTLKGIKFCEADLEEFSPGEVLQSGDWVEVFVNQFESQISVIGISLLSPNLSSRGHRSRIKTLVREWSRFWNRIQMFFISEGFEALQTPTLVSCPGTEPFLDPFRTEFILGSKRELCYLPTSPELHLKKCLALGWDRIFEMRPCFRNGEVSENHQPEFYMLEWYRAFSTMADVKRDVLNLVCTLAPEFKLCHWHHLSVAELFTKYLQFELKPSTSFAELQQLAEQHQVDISKATDFDEIFFYLFVEKIEPFLKDYDCLYLHSYPPSQAALARLTPDGWGDRFEFYIRGLEIANAFNELNNPAVQRSRSQEDIDKKKFYGKEPVSLDEEFFQCLEEGMPPSCGIALGLDRLFMAINGIKDIREFRLFPK